MLPEPAALDIDCRNLVLNPSRRCQRSSVAGVTTRPCRRRGGRRRASAATKARSAGRRLGRACWRQHCQLVTEQDEFDVFGELGTPTSNEQPQNSRESMQGKRKRGASRDTPSPRDRPHR